MGHVHAELRSEGRGLHEWDYVTFSEPRVVSMLIQNRMRMDEAYAEKCFPEPRIDSCGGMLFSEPVLATYVVLESLIHRAMLSDGQRMVVDLLMQGWSVQDIADEYEKSRQYVSAVLQRAVAKIVERNRKDQEKYCNRLMDTA